MKWIVEVVRLSEPGQPTAFYGPFDSVDEAIEYGHPIAADDVIVTWRHLNAPKNS